MSYIKKIEEEYNNGIISLDKLSKQREFYKKLSQDEKEKLNEKFGSKLNETNISKSIPNDKLVSEPVPKGIYYAASTIIGILYSFLHMSISSGGDLSKYYRPAEEFFLNFFAIILIHLIFAVPIWAFSNWAFSKGNFAKISLWTILIASFFALIGQSR
jgi:hypothetical protein